MAHILIVEDDQWLADCYKDWLHGHTVAYAVGAQEALDAADDQTPDLILLDLLLPHANGMQLLHTLRSHADWADVPVVLCSGSIPADVPDMRAYGVRAILDKATVTPTALRQAVNEAMHHATV